MIGFYFMKNFDDPYQAESITDLWRRWHISLSTWLRDYLYIPLGGSRISERRTYFNLMSVMLIGGLWHGASWNFVIWGGIHGSMLSLERSHGGQGFFRRLPRVARIGLTFWIVCIAWVFFRAETLGRSWEFLKSLFGAALILPGDNMVAAVIYTPYHLLSIMLCAIIVWGVPQTWNFTQRISPFKAAYCLATFALSVIVMWTQQVNPFLYFQF
jgi:alginate O-acetyltransferase complex protein AlgI